MTQQQWIKSLDRDEPVPPIDVTDRVMRTVRLRPRESDESSLAIPALLAALAGSTVALIALQLVTTMQDPFVNFLDSFKLVLQ